MTDNFRDKQDDIEVKPVSESPAVKQEPESAAGERTASDNDGNGDGDAAASHGESADGKELLEHEALGGGFPYMAADALWAAMKPAESEEEGVAEPSEGEVSEISTADGGSESEPKEAEALPEILPVFPVRHTVVFPFMLTPLQAGREKSVKVIEQALEGDSLLAIVSQKSVDVEDPAPDDLYPVATAAKIVKTLKLPDGSMNLLVQGLRRVKLVEFTELEPVITARVETIHETYEKTIELEGLIRNAQGLFQKIVHLTPYLPDELAIAALNIDEPEKLSDFIASSINLSIEEKAELLNNGDVLQRFQNLTVFLNREVEIVETGAKIQSQVRDEVDKSQREYYLRRQLELIQQELGQGDERSQEVAELRKKIDEVHMTEEAKEEALRELDRLSKMHPSAAEYTVSRSYLDWLVNLPWDSATKDRLDISSAEEVLNQDHYGLFKIKDRILEYLAVRKLKDDMKGPILCFVGPPGVGKTSLGQSIAKALGRKFIRLSLGGIHDEAEIRGHRRTYIGALPGKIMQGIRKAESKNPLFMLDEIDKVGSDYRGDPSSALLEVLDPQQNCSFQDHYLGVSFDLSQVMFVTTANLMDPIPPALRDRMEVLELPGYTEEEKLEIAKGFLVKRQLENHGISPGILEFEDGALLRIIREYTKEAGVRNLEREIGTVCRKVAREIALKLEKAGNPADERTACEPAEIPNPEPSVGAVNSTTLEGGVEVLVSLTLSRNGAESHSAEPSGSPASGEPRESGPAVGSDESMPDVRFETAQEKTVVTAETVPDYLGQSRFHYGLAGQTDEVGVVTGLTWTPVGGDIIFIETVLVEGRGALTLTGRLGETMQESAKAAMTYARSRAGVLDFNPNFYRKYDVHIHVPEGAIPKDGPSAGVTMATALISALTGRPVRKEVAMTGEITLRGKVLPIGGVKEKVLAAHRAGIKTILLPKENAKDVNEIPEHVRKDLKFIMAEHMDEILKEALDWNVEPVRLPGLNQVQA